MPVSLTASASPRVSIHDCPECAAINVALVGRVPSLPETAVIRSSHFLGGRHENLYADTQALAELARILAVACAQAADLLARPVAQLRIGAWFNIMRRGDVTALHTHEDGDELLSGVYYLQVPDDSGSLIVGYAERRKRLLPVARRFVFFAPDLPHEVTPHAADLPRISMGFNIGTVPE